MKIWPGEELVKVLEEPIDSNETTIDEDKPGLHNHNIPNWLMDYINSSLSMLTDIIRTNASRQNNSKD